MPKVRVKPFTRRTKGGTIARVGASQRQVKGRGKLKRIGGPKKVTRGPRTKGASFTALRSGTKAKDSIGKGPVGGSKKKTGPRQSARASAHAKAFSKLSGSDVAKKARQKGSHVGAGLKRLGKTGNRYTDASGKVSHRVGKGKKSRFVAGEPPKKKAAKKGKKSSGKKTSAMKRESKAVKKTSKRKASSKKKARR